MTDTLLLEHISSTEFTAEKLNAIRYIIENDVNVDVKFRAMKELAKLHQKYNELVLELGIDESCLVKPTDSVSTIRKKCKRAFGHGLTMDKMRTIYAVDDSPVSDRLVGASTDGGADAGGGDGGMGEAQLSYSYGVSPFDGAYKERTPEEEKETFTQRLLDPESELDFSRDREDEEEELEEAKSSTERVRKYYRNNPGKVRQYLKKTSKERAKRNRDRRKAIKKYGEAKMKNHDVHHPNGVHGKWELAPKDHGRDRKDGKVGNKKQSSTKSTTQKRTPQKKTTQKQPTQKKTQTAKPYSKIQSTINKFVDSIVGQLNIQDKPEIKIIQPTDDMTSLGSLDPQNNIIRVIVKDRLPADILRTIAHELVHVRQNELGKITNPETDGNDGSDIENQAHIVAGIIMRRYGRENKDIFVTENLNNTILCSKCLWRWDASEGGKDPYRCHMCWHDNSDKYLTEGGAAGHMTHPFEDKDLTFGDMKTMIDRALVGSLDVEEPATEKLDGQNIAFTVREDGEVVFARNKGHTKNRGKNALDVAGIRQKFAGRGSIEKAFGGAAEDLKAAVDKLSPEQREELFKGGANFMNIEVILPDSQNVIPYGRSVLVMHGTIEYDEDGNEVGRNNDAGRAFAKAVREVGEDRQKTFGIEGPRTIAFDDSVSEEYEQKAEEYKAALERAADEFDLGDDAKLEDYRRAWWEREVDTLDRQNNLNLSPKQKQGLVSRWADGDKKAFGVKDLESPEQKEWFRAYEKETLQNAQKKMIRPVEYAFLKTGTQALKRVTGWMAANNPDAADQIRRDTLEAIKGIRDSDDPDLIARMQQQIDKLDAMGLDNVVPSEGIVFTYNGNLYKFTGTFAPINQLTGTFKFAMPPKAKDEPEETPEKDSGDDINADVPDEYKDKGWKVELPKGWEDEQEPEQDTEAPAEPKRTVAIFAGRFHPFHRGHYSVYENLVERFGKENVYIASSNAQTDPVKQPFSFDQKKKIITTMFDVPDDMVVQVKNPYSPREILDNLPDDTTYVTAVSQKDADRLSGSKYFRSLEDTPEGERVGYKDGGYFAVTPEFQLDVNGKNISGTALRHVMGSDKYTDRAKEEIFTKVYGSFNKDIFDMITKVTRKAEEEREKTEKYKGDEESKERKGKAPDEEALERAKSVLRQKFKSPVTNRSIYVGTALKYPKDNPARAQAEKIVQAAMKSPKPKVEMVTEEKKPSKLKLYMNTRDFTNDELRNEVDEYFKNEDTFKLFPKLAKDRKELRKKILDAPTSVLDKDELKSLENSEVPEILTGKAVAKTLKRIETEYDKDVKGVLKAVKNEVDLAMPVVISHPRGFYLLGGNTRLSVLASIGHTMPVKLIKYDEDPTSNPNTGEKYDVGKKAATKKQARQKRFDDVLQMKITNPETGNQVKVDTAMDYKKTHPAHQIALSLIRQQMAGFSTRAGIPKNKRSS